MPTATLYQGDLAQRITGPDGKAMVLVPAGEFLMGSQSGLFDDQRPAHVIYLDAFYVDETEVTNAEFCRFLDERGNQEEGGVTWLDVDGEGCRIEHDKGRYTPQDGYADHPVVDASWYGARAYARWAGKRLPTEAEWEKAAVGTGERIYPWGNDWNPAKANTSNGGPGGTTPVGNYPAGASPYGALDMAGNVWEWCADWYDADYYQYSPSRNPTGPDAGRDRVLRGGSWIHYQGWARSVFRSGGAPASRCRFLGFRCCLSPGSAD